MVQVKHINSPTPQFSEAWLQLSFEEQTERLNRAMEVSPIRSFMTSNLYKGVVSVFPHNRIETGELGEALRQLEIHLRKHIGEPLEVRCETRLDTNKPRSPEQRQKIQDWLTNRKNMKQQADDEK